MVERPGFIEVDRLGSFAPRGLEVDVVLDLMIHDIDVIHGLFDDPVTDIRAAGVAVLSDEVDIANARLEFAGGCIANITASRVSVNRIRKVRIFQPETYFSADYSAQTLDRFELVRGDDGGPSISAQRLELPKVEPLVRELEGFRSLRRLAWPATCGRLLRTPCLANRTRGSIGARIPGIGRPL